MWSRMHECFVDFARDARTTSPKCGRGHTKAHPRCQQGRIPYETLGRHVDRRDCIGDLLAACPKCGRDHASARPHVRIRKCLKKVLQDKSEDANVMEICWKTSWKTVQKTRHARETAWRRQIHEFASSRPFLVCGASSGLSWRTTSSKSPIHSRLLLRHW